MMRFLKRMLAGFLRKMLPEKWMRLLPFPLLVPRYYHAFISEIENCIDSQKNIPALDDEYWSAQLRKFAHILDKGLNHRNFEPGHGQEYYQCALDALKRIQSDNILNDPSIEWARRVLKHFQECQSGRILEEMNSPPHPPGEDTYLFLKQIVEKRRSCRSFIRKPVSVEMLRRIADGARWAPSGCNKQPLKIFASNDPYIVRQCLETCVGATCFSEYVPAFFSFCADLRTYALPEEMWMPMVDVGLGAQNSSLIAYSIGISMTFLTWCQSTPHHDATLRKLLNIPKHYRIVLNAAAGFPAYIPETPVRKNVETIITIETLK